MSKRIYISSDYDVESGDREVVNELVKWGKDCLHNTEYIDMAEVKSGSVSNNYDCRICDLKEEFNRQINSSSLVIFVVGDKTSSRTAGDYCQRYQKNQYECYCTPYKQNSKGSVLCKVRSVTNISINGDFGPINPYSYLRHEFEQAKRKHKKILILYNSTRNELNWLPNYMFEYKGSAIPFWYYDIKYKKQANYNLLKRYLED